jgi:hypothetical protein
MHENVTLEADGCKSRRWAVIRFEETSDMYKTDVTFDLIYLVRIIIKQHWTFSGTYCDNPSRLYPPSTSCSLACESRYACHLPT